MPNLNALIAVIFLLVLLFSCASSKDAFDKSVVEHGIKKQELIRELAEFSVVYTLDKTLKVFSTDTLSDKDIKRKFDRNGYSGRVTVTYNNSENNKIFGLIDSTVVFKQTTLKGVTEIIYDFAANERVFEEDTSNASQYVFLSVANRIYYRKRPIPM